MKVLLIDDHPLILSAMQSVILGLGANVEALGVETAAECRAVLRRDSDFDLVLLDLHLDDASGFDLLGELRRGYPALPVVVVSASDRASDVIRAIDSGAMGFVPKRASNELLFEALHLVMSGGIYVPPMTLNLGDAALPLALSNGLSSPGTGSLLPSSMSAAVEDDRSVFDSRRFGVPRTGEDDSREASLERLGLTPRQREVLALLARWQVQQDDCAGPGHFGRDGEGPRRGGAAHAGGQLADPGGAGRGPDGLAGGGNHRVSFGAALNRSAWAGADMWPDSDPDTLPDRVSSLYAQLPASLLGQALAITAIGLLFLTTADSVLLTTVVGWMAIVGLSWVCRWRLHRAHANQPAPQVADWSAWCRRWQVSTLLNAGAWALALFWLYPLGNEYQQAGLFALLACLGIGSAAAGHVTTLIGFGFMATALVWQFFATSRASGVSGMSAWTGTLVVVGIAIGVALVGHHQRQSYYPPADLQAALRAARRPVGR